MANPALVTAVGSASNGWSSSNPDAGNSIIVACRGTTSSPTAVTYGGVALTKLGFRASNTDPDGVHIWGKKGGLPTGSNAISVAGFSQWAGSAIYSDVGSFGTVFSTFIAGNTTCTLTITGTTTNGICVAATAFGAFGLVTSTSPSVLEWEQHIDTNSASGNGWYQDRASVGGGSSTAITWTDAGNDWCGMIGLELIPAVASISASGGMTAKKPRMSGTSTEKSVASGSMKAKKSVMSGTSTEKSVASGGMIAKKPRMTGTSTEKSVASGSMVSKKPIMSGSTTRRHTGNGGMTAKKPRMSGTSTERSVASGQMLIKKPRMSGTSTERSVASGSMLAKKPVMFGTSHETSAIHGSMMAKKPVMHGSGIRAQSDALFIFSPL